MKTKTVKLILSVTVLALLSVVLYTSCSSDDPSAKVNKTELIAGIEAATFVHSRAAEGTASGQYQAGSKAALQAGITAAQAVVDDDGAKQSEVTAATVNLATAVGVFASKIILPVDPANLVGQWTFDEIPAATVGTDVADISGNGRNGTMKAGHAVFGAGIPALTADRYGVANKALRLNNGANVEIPYNTALNPASFSISAWVKLAEVRNNRFVGLHSWEGFKFEVQDGNKPFLTVAVTGGAIHDRDAVVSITQQEWHHLVVTYTAGTMVFYVNGVMVKTWNDTPNAALTIPKAYNLVLGCDFPTDQYSADANGTNFGTVGHADYKRIPAAWGGYFNGSLDQVSIYKVAITGTQATSIYNSEKP